MRMYLCHIFCLIIWFVDEGVDNSRSQINPNRTASLAVQRPPSANKDPHSLTDLSRDEHPKQIMFAMLQT